jgi:hypothetical protein
VKNIKTRIAAATTIVGLGGLTGLALSAGGQKSATLADKPLIRTKVIRRTIHVTKHVKPKHPVGAGAGAAYVGAGSAGSSGGVATGASSTGSTPSYSPSPVTTSSSGASTAAPTSSPAPVVTHTSGSSAGSGGSGGSNAPVVTHTSGAGGGGGGEHESERHDD